MSVEWDIPVGTITTRAKVAAKYGGATQGGIQPSASTPNIMIFTDPIAGARHGYANFDGWDSKDHSVFFYTGEGQDGDQEFRNGNKALRDHERDGRAIRLFEVVPGPRTPGGKQQRYVGEFRIDEASPWRREDDQRPEDPRSLIVFRLLATSDVAVTSTGSRPGPSDRETFTIAPAQNNPQDEVQRGVIEPLVARRREAKLMKRFEEHLEKLGHEIGCLRGVPKGSSRVLVSDTFDVTTRTLYEAKGATTRENVRMAIGQLLDYRRFIEPAPVCAVLLPVRPPQDLVDLIHSCGFTLVYEDGKTFTTEPPTSF
jgi:hypothetical protein